MTKEDWEAWLANPVTEAYKAKLVQKAGEFPQPEPKIGDDPHDFYSLCLAQHIKAAVYEDLAEDLNPQHYEAMFEEQENE